MGMRIIRPDSEFMEGFDEAARQDAKEFKRLDARIADLEAALKDCVRAMSLSIYPKPDAGPDHPWSVLKRAKQALGVET